MHNNLILGTQLFIYNTFSSQSPHNKGVMAKLVDELTKNPDNTYSVGTVSCKFELTTICFWVYEHYPN